MNSAWRAREGAKVRIGAHYGDKVRKAIEDSILVEPLVSAWFNLSLTPMKSQVKDNERAREWAKVNVYVDHNPLSAVLHSLYAEGWALGTVIARQALLKLDVTKAVAPRATARELQGINWDTWRAGNRAAAALIEMPRGLKQLMTSRMVTLRGVGNTTTDRIGTILGNALSKGLSPVDVRNEITALLKDPERALTIAQTEMSRAVSVASRNSYEETGVEYVEWLVADGCDVCDENEGASPIPIGEDFPSGDSEPPAHPNCMCSLAPYVVSSDGTTTDTLSSE